MKTNTLKSIVLIILFLCAGTVVSCDDTGSGKGWNDIIAGDDTGTGNEDPGDENTPPEGVIYVRLGATGAEDGSSWEDAFTHPQDALDAAEAGNQVWVAKGTYHLREDGDKQIIEMKADVALYGCFAGTETSLDQRPDPMSITISTDKTVLSDYEDAYNLVVGADNAVLDGFTIMGGVSKGDAIPVARRNGAGMYNNGCSVVIQNCCFSGNTCTVQNSGWGGCGAGMYNYNSTVTITNCTFQYNKALYGGAMYNSDSSVVMSGCSVYDNEAGSAGGMINSDSSLAMTDCVFRYNDATAGNGGALRCSGSSNIDAELCEFRHNSASLYGGAVDAREGSSFDVEDSTFSSNSAGGGAALYCYRSSPVIDGCTFSYNTATGSGGGAISNNGSSDNVTCPTIRGCLFYDNSSSDGDGGAIKNVYSSPNLYNCVFNGNSAVDGSGGAMYNSYSASVPVVINCTFVYNSVDGSGGAMYNYGCTPTVTNCILWYNTADTDYPDLNSGDVTYTCIETVYAGTGNVSSDPEFLNPGSNDFHLDAGSPCIDAANGNVALDHDYDGTLRWDDPLSDNNGIPFTLGYVDIGAFEYR